jgi:hypothetical protein
MATRRRGWLCKIASLTGVEPGGIILLSMAID